MYIIFKDAKRIRHGKSKCTLEFLFFGSQISWRELKLSGLDGHGPLPLVNSRCNLTACTEHPLCNSGAGCTEFDHCKSFSIPSTFSFRPPMIKDLSDLLWESELHPLPSLKKKKKINNDFFYLPFSHFWGVCMYEKYTMYIPPLLNSFPVDPSDFLKLPWEKIDFPSPVDFFVSIHGCGFFFHQTYDVTTVPSVKRPCWGF